MVQWKLSSLFYSLILKRNIQIIGMNVHTKLTFFFLFCGHQSCNKRPWNRHILRTSQSLKKKWEHKYKKPTNGISVQITQNTVTNKKCWQKPSSWRDEKKLKNGKTVSGMWYHTTQKCGEKLFGDPAQLCPTDKTSEYLYYTKVPHLWKFQILWLVIEWAKTKKN